MKASELRDKNDGELREELLALRREQFNLRMQAATGQLGRNSEFRNVRRDIARIKTIISERQHQQARSSTQGQRESGNA